MMIRKWKALLAMMLMAGSMAYAQTDPTIFTINGHAVGRSEFEYAYKKVSNLSQSKRQSKDDFLEQYSDYKRKVLAAIDAHLDQTDDFKSQMEYYNNLLKGNINVGDNATTNATVVTSSSNIESEARKEYFKQQQKVNANGGLIRCGQILIRLNHHASYQEEQRVRDLANSIYDQLRNGADFEALARKYSDDLKTKANGGMFPLVTCGMLLEEVENKLFSMQPGEISEPILSPFGYHIIKMISREQYPSYESVKNQIIHQLVVKDLRNQIINQHLGNSFVKKAVTYTVQNNNTSTSNVELEGDDKLLLQEIHDALLVDAITNKMFGKGVSDDEAVLNRYFNSHKKEYKGATKALVNKKGKLLKPKKMNDVRSLVQADLRKSLEDYWVKDLRKKYKVVIDKKNLSAI